MKIEYITGIFAIFLLSFILYVMINFTGQVEEKVNWCEKAGGIPIRGDKGHFKICLNPDAIIDMKDSQ